MPSRRGKVACAIAATSISLVFLAPLPGSFGAADTRGTHEHQLRRLEQRVADLKEDVTALEEALPAPPYPARGWNSARTPHERSETRQSSVKDRIEKLLLALRRLDRRITVLEDAASAAASRRVERTRPPSRGPQGHQLGRIARRVKRLDERVRALQAEEPVEEDPTGPLPVSCPQGAIPVGPSADLQAVLTAAGPGASVCVKPGTYRPAVSLRPLSRQILTFEEGAVLTGARVAAGWRRDGQYWVLDGQMQNFSDAGWLRTHRCGDNPAACIYEDLYRDGVPLVHTTSLEGLAANEVYFDKTEHRMYVSADPAGHEMEVTGLKIGIDSTASDVTIRGAVIEKVGWLGIKVRGRGWTMEDSEIRYAHATGLRLTGDEHVVRRNYFHHNGNSGIVATDGSGMLFKANELAFNNYLHFGDKPVPHHEGGAKFLNTSRVVLRGNYSHDNDGDGWWFDTDNIDILVEDNRFEDNSRNGLFYEVSFDAVIRNNVFKGNGADRAWMGSGIRIASSKNVEIAGNIFEGNDYSSLFANWVDRGSGKYGEHETTHLNVHDNTFAMRAGWIGSSWGLERIAAASAHNRFERNTYLVPDRTKRWWIWGSSRFLTWADWRALGFDVNGTMSVG